MATKDRCIKFADGQKRQLFEALKYLEDPVGVQWHPPPHKIYRYPDYVHAKWDWKVLAAFIMCEIPYFLVYPIEIEWIWR